MDAGAWLAGVPRIECAGFQHRIAEQAKPAAAGFNGSTGIMIKKSFVPAALLALPLVCFAQGDVPKGDAAAGAKKISMCIGCHAIPGYKASFPSVYSVPMISGQSAGYLSAALASYRKGDRSHPTMRAIAASLSDQDIADLAAYYASR